MTITRLQATFGCLENAELRLEEGLNLLQLPNESGKSTWCAFLLAMFYGVDSSERARGDQLPVKTRYAPWSGAPMTGLMELRFQGRDITITRSSDRRGSFNQFRAVYSDSSEPVPGLTAENCGRTLLGVEKSVFERSAFLRQAGHRVGSDPALEARLQALVTTGEEGVSRTQAAEVLRDARNRLGRPKTGKLSKVEAELASVEQSLQSLRDLDQQIFSLTAEAAAQRRELARLEDQLAQAKTQQQLAKQRQLDEALNQAQDATRAANEAIQLAQGLPDEQTLIRLAQEAAALPPRPRAPEPSLPPQPVAPAPLRNLTGEAFDAQLQKDLADFDAPDALPRPNLLPMILAVLLAACGLVALFFLLPLGLGLILVGMVTGYFALRIRKKEAQAAQKADELRAEVQKKYAAVSRDEILRQAERYRADAAVYLGQRAELAKRQQAYALAQADYARQVGAFLAKLSRIAPAKTPEQAVQALQDALRRRRGADQAKAAANQARSYYSNLKSALGPITLPDGPVSPEPIDQAAAEAELRSARSHLAALESRLDRLRGQLSAMGDPDALTLRQEALQAERETLQLHVSALDTALAALDSAGEEVQRRISPALSRRAGELMSQLTNERYDQVRMDAELRLTARLSGQIEPKSASFLSIGAADQLYLALRLAICELALGQEAPLVLDDALVMFDEDRCARALRLFRELAGTRQILLFTCQSREARLLQTL